MTLGAMFVALLLKPALVIGAAAMLVRVLQRNGAAARHAIWAGSLLAVLVLPLLAGLLPAIRVGAVLDAVWQSAPAQALLDSRASPGEPRAGSGVVAPELTPMVSSASMGDLAERSALVAWALVALILLVRRFASEVASRRLVARAKGAPPALHAQCAAFARARGITQHVDVVISRETVSPAVGGLVRPAIVLPESAAGWTDAETSAVLVHELSHVARRDCLVNLAADVARAMYWCNPAVHLAVRRLRSEGEHACDDAVLRAGGKPDAYAGLLIAFAKLAGKTTALPRAATAMARPSELERRVMAVLADDLPRAALGRVRLVSLAALGATLALPVAAATLAAEPVAQAIGIEQEPDLRADSLASPSSERLAPIADDAVIREKARHALSGPDSAAAAVLFGALSHAPAHENDFVRDRARWALSQTRGDRLLEPVIDALDARDWRVQSYAAWTVAVAGDRRALPRLLTLARHPVWRLRAMAAFALRSMGDRRADDAMLDALSDPAWQVRMEAVQYLGATGNVAHLALVRTRLDDRHVAVRLAAARALDTR